MRAHVWARGFCTPIAAAARIVAGGSDPGGFGRRSASVPLARATGQAAGALTAWPAAGAESYAQFQGECPGEPPQAVSVALAIACRRPTTPLGERPALLGPPCAAKPCRRRHPPTPRHADAHRGRPRAAGGRASAMSDHAPIPPTAGRKHRPALSSMPGRLGRTGRRGSVDLAIGTTAAAAQQGSRTNGQRRQRPGLRDTGRDRNANLSLVAPGEGLEFGARTDDTEPAMLIPTAEIEANAQVGLDALGQIRVAAFEVDKAHRAPREPLATKRLGRKGVSWN